MHPPEMIDADCCVLGAGIVGLAHALEARARNLRVVVLERDVRAVGASVRNFGHAFVAAMADGEPLDVALRARERWVELGRAAGLGVIESGSLIVARHEDELAVLRGVADDERRGARLIGASEVSELAPIPIDRVCGALHTTLDVRVDPRAAVAGLANALERDPGARIVWGARVDSVEPGVVSAGAVVVRAPLVVLAPGPGYRSLPEPLQPRRNGLTLCKLQMLRVRAPEGRSYRPALLTGLSLLRYPGFAQQSGASAVRERLESEEPELVAAGVHLIVTQLPDGDLIIGDTHEYGAPVSPFDSARLDELVLAQARRLLGVERLDVVERWHGVYPTAPGDPFLVEAPMPGVRVVEVVSGVGMTTALGLAPRVLDDLLAEPNGRPQESARSVSA